MWLWVVEMLTGACGSFDDGEWIIRHFGFGRGILRGGAVLWGIVLVTFCVGK